MRRKFEYVRSYFSKCYRRNCAWFSKLLLRGPEYQTFCKCEICELDTVALTLNALPSKYVTSMEARDEAFKEMNTPGNIERINKEIIHALHVVNKYPRHKIEPTS